MILTNKNKIKMVVRKIKQSKRISIKRLNYTPPEDKIKINKQNNHQEQENKNQKQEQRKMIGQK